MAEGIVIIIKGQNFQNTILSFFSSIHFYFRNSWFFSEIEFKKNDRSGCLFPINLQHKYRDSGKKRGNRMK